MAGGNCITRRNSINDISLYLSVELNSAIR